MKRAFSLILTAMLLLSLCACGGAASAPTPEAAPMTDVPAESGEPVTELVLEERIPYGEDIGDKRYFGEILLFPQLGQFKIRSFPNGEAATLYSGTYREEKGLYTLDAQGEIIQFRREADGVYLEKGSLTAYLWIIWNEETQSYDDVESTESVQLEAGDLLHGGEIGYIYLRDGIYVLKTDEGGLPADQVLLDLDLTGRTFALKCYDGSVIRGTLEFQQNYDSCFLACRYDGGAIGFSAHQRWTVGADGQDLQTTVLSDATYGLENTIADERMYYPEQNGVYYHFYHDPSRTDEITEDPDVVPLDSFKQVAQEAYGFQMPVPEDPETSCALYIYHYPLAEKWHFSAKYGLELEGTEQPDGTITLTDGTQSWNFHRENNCLVFDSGDPLIARNWEVDGPQYEMALEPGTRLTPNEFQYYYDTHYVALNQNGSWSWTLKIDWENRRVCLANSGGYAFEGPLSYAPGGTWLRSELGDTGLQIFFRGHGLEVKKYSVWTPAAEPQEFYFLPTWETEELQELTKFVCPALPLAEAPPESILVFEEFALLGMERSGGSNSGVYTANLVLNREENRYYYNDEYTAFYAEGGYTEENGTITLDQSEIGHGKTQLRREDTCLVLEEGDPLYLCGMPLTANWEWMEPLDPGTRILRVESGWLHSGTYAFGEKASVTFDTENRTFTLTDAGGTAYEGSFRLERKFVYCDAGSQVFQFIPYGDQVRLNQREFKVVPGEEDFIFFDFAQ